jgi:hypothetical protein
LRLLAELKRRNVIRMAAPYLVRAWLVAQNAAGFAYQIAQVRIWRGERGQALDWLATAIDQRDLGAPRMRWDPLFAPLHGDDRFQALLSRIPTSE